MGTYGNRRTVDCPYCQTPGCECDWVDVGIGEVQCGPYFCESCGASEIGPEYPEIKDTLTEFEKKCHWYDPKQQGGSRVSPHANTVHGTLVDHKTATKLYRMGLLDKPQDKPGYKPRKYSPPKPPENSWEGFPLGDPSDDEKPFRVTELPVKLKE